jgi:hypothetical protein
MEECMFLRALQRTPTMERKIVLLVDDDGFPGRRFFHSKTPLTSLEVIP